MQMKSTRAKVQAILQSLKCGVVPPYGYELYHVGREAEAAEFKRCLELAAGGHGVVKFITGEYGAGKTFFLAHLQKMAQDKKFVIARLQLNKSFKFNKMEEVYYQVMHNLAVNTFEVNESGFERIFDLWLKELGTLPTEEATARVNAVTESLYRQSGDFARVFMAYVRGRIQGKQEQVQVASSWIKGETRLPAHLKQLIDVKGRVDRELSLEFLEAFVHMIKLLGYSGLLLMVDELESILSVRADIRRAIYENLKYLLDRQMPCTLFVFVGTDRLLYDERGIIGFEPLAQRLKLNELPGKERDLRQPVVRLEPLTLAEITNLTKRIMLIHHVAYEWEADFKPEVMRNWTLHEINRDGKVTLPVNTRLYIQELIKLLDLLQKNGGMPVEKSPLQLVERDGEFYLQPA